jgi:hypothetical protein
MEGRGNAVMSVLIGEHSHLLMIYLKKNKKVYKKNAFDLSENK